MSEPDAFDPNASTDELISFALSHPPTEEWPDPHRLALLALHERGTREVFNAATRLLESGGVRERTLGANVHSQLGYEQQKPFATESVRLLVRLLETETDPNVIYAALMAFGHLGQPECVPAALRFADHSDPDVRYAVAFALPGLNDPRAIGTLITLTSDSDVRVRDWATFALGSLTDRDTPALRAALWARLGDSDNIVRGEALKGLALRKDERAVDAIIAELRGPDPHEYAVEAADELDDPRLVPALEALRLRWGEQGAWLESVIEECRAGRGSR